MFGGRYELLHAAERVAQRQFVAVAHLQAVAGAEVVAKAGKGRDAVIAARHPLDEQGCARIAMLEGLPLDLAEAAKFAGTTAATRQQHQGVVRIPGDIAATHDATIHGQVRAAVGPLIAGIAVERDITPVVLAFGGRPQISGIAQCRVIDHRSEQADRRIATEDMDDGIAAATAACSTGNAAKLAIELHAEIMADRQGELTAAESRKTR